MKYNVNFLENFRNKSTQNIIVPEGNYLYVVDKAFVEENIVSKSSEQSADVLNLQLSITDANGDKYKTSTQYYNYRDCNSPRFDNFIEDLKKAYCNDSLYNELFPNDNDTCIEESYLVGTTGALTIVYNQYKSRTYVNVGKLIPKGTLSSL
jgi:hypothetical protein